MMRIKARRCIPMRFGASRPEDLRSDRFAKAPAPRESGLSRNLRGYESGCPWITLSFMDQNLCRRLMPRPKFGRSRPTTAAAPPTTFRLVHLQECWAVLALTFVHRIVPRRAACLFAAQWPAHSIGERAAAHRHPRDEDWQTAVAQPTADQSRSALRYRPALQSQRLPTPSASSLAITTRSPFTSTFKRIGSFPTASGRPLLRPAPMLACCPSVASRPYADTGERPL
jgi:hypothetical protein